MMASMAGSGAAGQGLIGGPAPKIAGQSRDVACVLAKPTLPGQTPDGVFPGECDLSQNGYGDFIDCE